MSAHAASLEDLSPVDRTPAPLQVPADTPPSQPIPETPALPTASLASFWRRLGAFVVDGLFVGIVAQVFGFLLKDFLFGIGPYGRFIGLAVLLLYFSTLNSVLGNGQTLGKRLFRIAVRGANGQPISVWRALLRSTILVLPLLLNGWQLPIFASNLVVNALAGVVVFGIAGGLVYTMLFNWKTRQGLHDLICKTYVVKLPLVRQAVFPQTRRIHWIVSLGLVGASLLLILVLNFIATNNVSSSPWASMQKLQQTLSADERFFNWRIAEQKVFSTQQTSLRILNVNGWYKGLPTQEERKALINVTAKKVLQNYPDINQFDRLQVTILSQYDLGIAEGHIYEGDIETISFWYAH